MLQIIRACPFYPIIANYALTERRTWELHFDTKRISGVTRLLNNEAKLMLKIFFGPALFSN